MVIVAKKSINTNFKLGENTLLLETLISLGIDFPIQWSDNYTKWYSGRLEANRYRNISYGTEVLVDLGLPSDLSFITDPTPSYVTSVQRAGGYNSLNAQGKGVASNGRGVYVYVNATAGSLPESGGVTVHIKGRWK